MTTNSIEVYDFVPDERPDVGFFMGFGISTPISWLPEISFDKTGMIHFTWLFLEIFIGWPSLVEFSVRETVDWLCKEIDDNGGSVAFERVKDNGE